MYFEANGSFTLIKEEQPKSGLAIIPEWDDYIDEQKKTEQKVCKNCGKHKAKEDETSGNCVSCGKNEWQTAIL